MRFFLGIQFLLISLLVSLPPSAACACGDHLDSDHVQKFHHQHEQTTDHHTCCCAKSADSQNDYEENNHCHCPGCSGHAGGSHAGGLAADSHIFFTVQPSDALLKKQAFYFSKHLPEALLAHLAAAKIDGLMPRQPDVCLFICYFFSKNCCLQAYACKVMA